MCLPGSGMPQTGAAGTPSCRAAAPGPSRGEGEGLGALFGCFIWVLFGGAFSPGGRCPIRRRLAKGLPFLRAHLP